MVRNTIMGNLKARKYDYNSPYKTQKQVTEKSGNESNYGLNLSNWSISIIITGIYFVCLLFTLGSYGVTTDEHADLLSGFKNLDFYLGKGLDIEAIGDRIYYGPMANMLYAISVIIFSQTLHILEQYDAMHLVEIIFGALTVFCTYWIAMSIFKDKKAAIFSAVILIMMPRFFGDAHNNPKDLPLTFFLALASLFFLRYLEDRKTRTFLLFSIGLACSFAVKFTAVIILPVYALVFLAFVYFKKENLIEIISKEKWVYLKGLVVFLISLYVLWPYLVLNPVNGPVEIYKFSSTLPDFGENFNGIGYPGDVPKPGYYAPLFLAITIPILTLALLVFGTYKMRQEISNNPSVLFPLIFILIVFIVFAFPIPKYNGIRQFLYILVPISLLSGFGLYKIYKIIENMKEHQKLFFGLLAILILYTAYDGLVRIHPGQTFYFNELVGKIENVNENHEFRVLYWEGYMRPCAEYIDKQVFTDSNVGILQGIHEVTPYISNKQIKIVDIYQNQQLIITMDYLVSPRTLAESGFDGLESLKIFEKKAGEKTLCSVYYTTGKLKINP